MVMFHSPGIDFEIYVIVDHAACISVLIAIIPEGKLECSYCSIRTAGLLYLLLLLYVFNIHG